MKSFFIILLVLASTLRVVFGQITSIDSLRRLLAHMPQDTNRALLPTELAGNYQFFESDSAIILVRQAIELSKKLNFKKGEARATSRLGEVLHIRGELPQSLEEQLKALQLSRKNNDLVTEAECLIFIGIVYLELGEYRQSLRYLFQSKKIYENISNQLPTFGVSPQFPPFGLSNIGEAYEKMNMLDSALYFQKQALSYPIKLGYSLRALILIRLGIIQRQLKNYKDALHYYQDALRTSYLSQDLLNRSRSQYQIAEIYSLQNIDSSLYYAQKAFINAQMASQKTAQLDASSLLTKLYMVKGKMDSAFYYKEIAVGVQDSLFGLE